jgi:hypothetical protein
MKLKVNFIGNFIVLLLVGWAGPRPSSADEPRKADGIVFKAHKNHVRKSSAEYLACFRRITWHYDFETAAELARQTGRPMFVIFCRAGTIDDPLTGKPKCAS